MMKFTMRGNYFDGSFHMSATSGLHVVDKIISKYCPADINLKLWECPVDFNHIDEAMESSRKGFKIWRKMKVEDRIGFLKSYQKQVVAIKDELAQAIALETGKPLWEAYTEVSAVISKVDVTINESLPRIATKTIEEILPQTDGAVYYRPIGPCFIIGPFNFPCHLANGQILSALIAGNSIIFKPSEKTCYSAQLLIECFDKAKFPVGVINLLHGEGETARRVLKSKAIKGVFFTGSKEIGLKVLDSTNQDLGKLVCLELGGKNTTIIHKDASIKHALCELLKASFLTAGQRCTSTSLVMIHRDIKEKFIDDFHNLAKKIIIDHPIDFKDEPFMGPLIDQQALDTYLLYMGMAKREGLEEIMRGKHLSKKHPGLYVSPSIHYVEKFNDKCHFLTNEVFAPNCTFLPYDEIEDAIEMANKTEYGLASAVFTQDETIYQLCIQDLEAGLINLNRSTVGASAKLPFGGIKNSGNYRPAAITSIDACVYSLSSLKVKKEEDLSNIKGIVL